MYLVEDLLKSSAVHTSHVHIIHKLHVRSFRNNISFQVLSPNGRVSTIRNRNTCMEWIFLNHIARIDIFYQEFRLCPSRNILGAEVLHVSYVHNCCIGLDNYMFYTSMCVRLILINDHTCLCIVVTWVVIYV